MKRSAIGIFNGNWKNKWNRELDDNTPRDFMDAIDARLELANVLQAPGQDEFNRQIGREMEQNLFIEIVEFANTDPDHILNAQQDVDWRTEVEARAAESADWDAQVTELRNQ